MSTTPVNPEHSWFVGGIGTDLIYSDTRKAGCLDWIARRHNSTAKLPSTKYPTGGYIAVIDDTKYLVMPRDVAVTQGYRLTPGQATPAPTAAPVTRHLSAVSPAVKSGDGLGRGEARAGVDDTGHVFIEWRNHDGVYRIQTGPPADTVDPAAWTARMAGHLVHYRIALKEH